MISFTPDDENPTPKRSLILAGGGMRVSYQAGVLKALEQTGLTFHHIDGTSGGTMNLAMLMSGLSPSQMIARWQNLNVSDFVSLMPFREYIKLSFMPAWGDADGIIEKVFPHLGIDVEKINTASGLQGTFNVCNYSRKINQVFPHHSINRNLLVAGISLPIFMPAVEHNNELFIDSVWIKDANLMEAVKQGAEEIYLIWCIGNHNTYHDGAFNQYVHMIEMSANGVLNLEFDWINELNKRISNGDSPYGQTKPIELTVIKPDQPLPLDPDLYLGKITNASLIEMGYDDCHTILQKQSQSVAFDYTATHMKNPTPGLIYNEIYRGKIKNHEKNEDINCELNLTVHIENADDFVTSGQPSARITGLINCELFPENSYLNKSHIRFDNVTANPAEKTAEYQLNFSTDKENYKLIGEKNLRDDPGFDAWSDVTNLQIKIINQQNPDFIIASGTLKLGISEVAKLIASFHPVYNETTAQGATLVAKFGKFLLGEYYQQYLRPTKKWWKVW